MVRYNSLLPVIGLAVPTVTALHSINNDVFAYPQYDVVFSNSYISRFEANTLVAKGQRDTLPSGASEATHPTSNSDVAQPGASPVNENSESEDIVNNSYEILNIGPDEYLCSIPMIALEEPQNATAAELARENEAKEISRALEVGWNILKSMDGECLYFMSGWWSYKYCYDSYIVQFHAQAQPPGHAPPVPDPHMAAYVLGRASKQHHEDGNWLDEEWQKGAEDIKSSTTDMQVKGDQRFLVHKLTGGTMCDLTHRERTIEIQYHCDPNASHDSIAWIKEITTCSYLMVVNTPRLCQDAAFLPQKEVAANLIQCRDIAPEGLSQEEVETWFAQRQASEAEYQSQQIAPLIDIKTKSSTDEDFIMIEVDANEISQLTEDEFKAMAQKLANEAAFGLAKKHEAEIKAQKAQKTSKDKQDDTDDIKQKKQELQKLVDSLGGHGLDDDYFEIVVDIPADTVEQPTLSTEELEDMLDAYMEMARNYVRSGKKIPSWLKDHIKTLQETLGHNGVNRDASDSQASDEKSKGSKEEYHQQKDEL